MATLKVRPYRINLYPESPSFTTSISEGKSEYVEKDMYTLFAKGAFDSIPSNSTINNIWLTFDAYCTSGESSVIYDHKALWRLNEWIRTDGWDGSYSNYNTWYSTNNKNFSVMYTYGKQGSMEVQITETQAPGSSYTMGKSDGNTSDLLGSYSPSLSDLKDGVHLKFKARRKGRGSVTMGMSDLYLNIDYTPPSYYLDLNGMLDGDWDGNISPYGTADIYINGSLVSTGATDYYSAHESGSTYEIKNIKANEGYRYDGVYSGSLSGTLTAATSVVLSFSTKTVATITFDGNGATSGSVSSITGYVGDSITLPSNSFVKYWTVTFDPNYSGAANTTKSSLASFCGWYTDSSGETLAGTAGGMYTPTNQSVKLYAKWGDGAFVSVPHSPIRDNYSFIGWYTQDGEYVDMDDVYTPTRDITIYARWSYNTINKFYVGTKQPSFYAGTKRIRKIYKGTTLIYDVPPQNT